MIINIEIHTHYNKYFTWLQIKYYEIIPDNIFRMKYKNTLDRPWNIANNITILEYVWTTNTVMVYQKFYTYILDLSKTHQIVINIQYYQCNYKLKMIVLNID